MSNEKDSAPAEIENMDELWVSNNGDDMNDGATRNAAIYSLKRAPTLQREYRTKLYR